MIELSGFLKELQGTYDLFFSDGNINNRMQTVESRYLLLEHLISELMTQKMLLVTQKPKDQGSVITIVRLASLALNSAFNFPISSARIADRGCSQEHRHHLESRQTSRQHLSRSSFQQDIDATRRDPEIDSRRRKTSWKAAVQSEEKFERRAVAAGGEDPSGSRGGIQSSAQDAHDSTGCHNPELQVVRENKRKGEGHQ